MKTVEDSPILRGLTVTLVGLFATGCLSLSGSSRSQETDEQPTGDCSGVSCWEPPKNTCADDDEVEVHAPSGYCSGGKCFYAAGQVPCHEGLCDEGICVDTPCQGVTCVNPPVPECTGAGRKNYAPTGYCTGGDCRYASKTSTCDDVCESGACVDSPCAEVFCRKPPAPYCEDDSNLVVFSPEGRCRVVQERPECVYDEHTLPCPNGCHEGRCLDDPCAGVVCDYPPAKYCDGAVLVVFEPHGTCDENGMCSYAEARRPCIEPCVDAHCGEDDACAGVTCDKPLAPYCQSDTVLVDYLSSGTCDKDSGYCEYETQESTCAVRCENGACTKETEDRAWRKQELDLGDPDLDWVYAMAFSSDGTKLAIVAINESDLNGYVFSTTNDGVSWTRHTTAGLRSWTDIDMSPDGTKIYATARDDHICISKDSGATWTEQTSAGTRAWTSIASSSDGTKLAAVVNGGFIYTSTDSGASWTEQTSAEIRAWKSIASSSDGTKLAAVVNGGFIHTSTDSGASWTERTSAGSRQWNDIASSIDGTRLVAAGDNDYVFSSNDGGDTWIEKRVGGQKDDWQAVASSSNGLRIVAAPQGVIYTSSDGGDTWIEQGSTGHKRWHCAAMSSDGAKIAVSAKSWYAIWIKR